MSRRNLGNDEAAIVQAMELTRRFGSSMAVDRISTTMGPEEISGLYSSLDQDGAYAADPGMLAAKRLPMKTGSSILRRIALITTIVAVFAQLLAGCASTPVEPYKGASPKLATLYVVAGGWHTEIGLPADALTGPLASLLRQDFAGSPYLLFGWGQRDYYMAEHPGLADLLAAVVPGPAVMLVTPLNQSPMEVFPAPDVFAVRVSREGMDRLSQYLWEYVAKDANGASRRAGDGPMPHSVFYASTGTYDLGHTCNTWTAEALHVAGLPVNAAGIIFAGQVVRAIQPLTAPESGPEVPRSEGTTP